MRKRIVSLIPSATEILGKLLEDRQRLVGVTHECDFPDWVKHLPRVIHPADPALMEAAPADVDQAVAASIGSGTSLYVIDEKLLQELEPDLIVTQRLCDVCAASPDQVIRAIAGLARQPELLELAPMRLADVLEDVERVGAVVDERERAAGWRAELRSRLERVKERAPFPKPPRVLALEWPDPLWAGGHWVPEMIELAGGIPIWGVAGQPSERISWEHVREAQPDIVVVMSCGYGIEKNREQLPLLARMLGWSELPAVQRREVYYVDANSLFSRSAPRLVDGVELLANIFRGETVPATQCGREA